jgi:hypothetical protein
MMSFGSQSDFALYNRKQKQATRSDGRQLPLEQAIDTSLRGGAKSPRGEPLLRAASSHEAGTAGVVLRWRGQQVTYKDPAHEVLAALLEAVLHLGHTPNIGEVLIVMPPILNRTHGQKCVHSGGSTKNITCRLQRHALQPFVQAGPVFSDPFVQFLQGCLSISGSFLEVEQFFFEVLQIRQLFLDQVLLGFGA